MKTIELTAEQAQGLLYGDVPPELDWRLVEERDWQGGGKYQEKSTIYAVGELFYAVSGTRSGSYYTHYDVDVEYTAVQVEKVEVITTKWINA